MHASHGPKGSKPTPDKASLRLFVGHLWKHWWQMIGTAAFTVASVMGRRQGGAVRATDAGGFGVADHEATQITTNVAVRGNVVPFTNDEFDGAEKRPSSPHPRP